MGIEQIGFVRVPRVISTIFHWQASSQRPRRAIPLVCLYHKHQRGDHYGSGNSSRRSRTHGWDEGSAATILDAALLSTFK
ncbi:hypothetical protein CDO30_31820 (plasmid) [Sinorhizobium meliloti]|nr:hypothetical protein CDO30_31820 [Sinorhizobium meliloti]QGJ77903.1 hypothetical protein C3L21_29150 [Sinorhizobium meliloti]